MPKQVLSIHGGDTFETYDDWMSYLKVKPVNFDRIRQPLQAWKEWLREGLGNDYEVVLPEMPNKQNAKYAEWKIWFETICQHINDKIILVGHSLGGIFLAKYLSENNFSKKILGTFLVSACFDAKDTDYSLGDFILPESLDLLAKQGGKVIFYHSEDDPVVPFGDLKKFQNLLPTATYRVFQDRGHFNQGTFPEIVADIKAL